jgi:prepilin signal peptidase PulO-like enzyme (type II secretory pathway)
VIAALPVTAALGWSAAGAAIADGLSRQLSPGSRRDRLGIFLLAGAAGVAALALGGGLSAALTCSGLTAAAVLDARSGYLVDELTLPTAALGFASAACAGSPASALLGMAGLAVPAAAAGFFSRGTWLGWGDVKALLALGAGFGLERGSIALAIGCGFGAAAALVMHRRNVRFGPYLAAGSVAALALGAGGALGATS